MSYFDFYLHRLPNLLRQVRRLKRNNAPKFYAVAVGRRIGIYRSWPSCKVQIDGIVNAKYRRFDSHLEALDFLKENPKETPIPAQNYDKPIAEWREAIVYTDGSCWRNGMPDATAGIGIYWPEYEEHNLSRLIEGRQTSVRAELRAVITAMEQAKEMGIDCLTIYTDSHFVIQTATQWLWKWNQNGWKTSSGHDVKNRSDLMELDIAVKQLRKVIWRPVAAHTGIKGNEEADKLANSAIATLLGSKSLSNKKSTTTLRTDFEETESDKLGQVDEKK